MPKAFYDSTILIYSMNYNKNRKLKYLMAISIFVLFTGCVNNLPSPDTPPGEIVKIFASSGGNYDLMSEAYKNSTSRWAFKEIANKCNPANWGSYYKFVEVINGSEKIEGDIASVEIVHLIKKADLYDDEFENKTKTIYLIKEKNGWRLRESYCELRTK